MAGCVITNRWTGSAVFEAEIDAPEGASPSVKLGLVKAAPATPYGKQKPKADVARTLSPATSTISIGAGAAADRGETWTPA